MHFNALCISKCFRYCSQIKYLSFTIFLYKLMLRLLSTQPNKDDSSSPGNAAPPFFWHFCNSDSHQHSGGIEAWSYICSYVGHALSNKVCILDAEENDWCEFQNTYIFRRKIENVKLILKVQKQEASSWHVLYRVVMLSCLL